MPSRLPRLSATGLDRVSVYRADVKGTAPARVSDYYRAVLHQNIWETGQTQVVPGTYRIADYEVFLIYLVNEQDYIMSALLPMGEYDNLYALKGINCRDIDGDGLKDIIVLAKYSYEDEEHKLAVASDYSIYYQRTGGFSADTEIKSQYPCTDEDTMQTIVEKARAYWGWETDND